MYLIRILTIVAQVPASCTLNFVDAGFKKDNWCCWNLINRTCMYACVRNFVGHFDYLFGSWTSVLWNIHHIRKRRLRNLFLELVAHKINSQNAKQAKTCSVDTPNIYQHLGKSFILCVHYELKCSWLPSLIAISVSLSHWISKVSYFIFINSLFTACSSYVVGNVLKAFIIPPKVLIFMIYNYVRNCKK